MNTDSLIHFFKWA